MTRKAMISVHWRIFKVSDKLLQWMVIGFLVLFITLANHGGGVDATCVWQGEGGMRLACGFKQSGMFRLRSFGGLKGWAGAGFTVADEDGFKDSLTNREAQQGSASAHARQDAESQASEGHPRVATVDSRRWQPSSPSPAQFRQDIESQASEVQHPRVVKIDSRVWQPSSPSPVQFRHPSPSPSPTGAPRMSDSRHFHPSRAPNYSSRPPKRRPRPTSQSAGRFDQNLDQNPSQGRSSDNQKIGGKILDSLKSPLKVLSKIRLPVIPSPPSGRRLSPSASPAPEMMRASPSPSPYTSGRRGPSPSPGPSTGPPRVVHIDGRRRESTPDQNNQRRLDIGKPVTLRYSSKEDVHYNMYLPSNRPHSRRRYPPMSEPNQSKYPVLVPPPNSNGNRRTGTDDRRPQQHKKTDAISKFTPTVADLTKVQKSQTVKKEGTTEKSKTTATGSSKSGSNLEVVKIPEFKPMPDIRELLQKGVIQKQTQVLIDHLRKELHRLELPDATAPAPTSPTTSAKPVIPEREKTSTWIEQRFKSEELATSSEKSEPKSLFSDTLKWQMISDLLSERKKQVSQTLKFKESGFSKSLVAQTKPHSKFQKYLDMESASSEESPTISRSRSNLDSSDSDDNPKVEVKLAKSKPKVEENSRSDAVKTYASLFSANKAPEPTKYQTTLPTVPKSAHNNLEKEQSTSTKNKKPYKLILLVKPRENSNPTTTTTTRKPIYSYSPPGTHHQNHNNEIIQNPRSHQHVENTSSPKSKKPYVITISERGHPEKAHQIYPQSDRYAAKYDSYHHAHAQAPSAPAPAPFVPSVAPTDYFQVEDLSSMLNWQKPLAMIPPTTPLIPESTVSASAIPSAFIGPGLPDPTSGEYFHAEDLSSMLKINSPKFSGESSEIHETRVLPPGRTEPLPIRGYPYIKPTNKMTPPSTTATTTTTTPIPTPQVQYFVYSASEPKQKSWEHPVPMSTYEPIGVKRNQNHNPPPMIQMQMQQRPTAADAIHSSRSPYVQIYANDPTTGQHLKLTQQGSENSELSSEQHQHAHAHGRIQMPTIQAHAQTQQQRDNPTMNGNPPSPVIFTNFQSRPSSPSLKQTSPTANFNSVSSGLKVEKQSTESSSEGKSKYSSAEEVGPPLVVKKSKKVIGKLNDKMRNIVIYIN